MGTPEFAVASLDALIKSGAHIVGVVTALDKPAGRGMKITQSAVKKYATAHGLNVLQPEKLRDPAFIAALQSLHADLQVVVAFRMLPEIVWNMPPMGTVNLHGSLLPRYRGAAPINWAVIHGDSETGVTIFRLRHEIDTGDVLMQEKMPIAPDDNAGDVHDRMMLLGAEALVKAIKKMANGDIQPLPQDKIPVTPTPAPKLNADNCKISWDAPLNQVYNQIRGLAPYPGAYTLINEKVFKIFAGEKIILPPSEIPGQFKTVGNKELLFACKDGYYKVTDFQPQGKKRMSPEAFMRGNSFE